MEVVRAVHETRRVEVKEGRVILYQVLVRWKKYIYMFNAKSALKFSDTLVFQALIRGDDGQSVGAIFDWLRLNPLMNKHVNDMHDLSLEHRFQRR
uniref:Uncharacterized protein n=1 Tax=Peronospora matthiolae TaxID=2874970 RepID=A0AAV1UL36_9STRA